MTIANTIDRYWMPFTANRQFKAAPRMMVSASGMYYCSDTGQKVMDGTSGLWCCNAGHNNPKIVEAIQKQAAQLDYSPGFQMGHPAAFELSQRLIDLAPEGFGQVFFTNSGSESVDTALKIALAYHRVRGEGSRTRLIGRERGYHGAGFGGISVGGLVANRKMFGTLLAGVDHLRHTHDLSRNAFSRGMPEHGAELAEDLERMVALHDPSTIAAVIVEPVACSGGVLVPPPGYLERLRAICDRHGILLIFDEVITGFGRLGANFAAQYFGVRPDIITTAKGLTNGCVPMGAVLTASKIYDQIVDAAMPDAIEFAHGYTYSGHPLACAAALATLDVYAEDDLFTRVADLAPYWQQALHGLDDARHVIDVRDLGLIGAIELEPRPGAPGARAFELYRRCYEQGLLVRATGDIIALSPPFIVSEDEIDEMMAIIGRNLATLD
ncbi:MAG: aspartate aminotransferase family protein [Rhizobium sp.]|nr:MAG: aspartate aminotransferase family protein [Rhizobium sp.]